MEVPVEASRTIPGAMICDGTSARIFGGTVECYRLKFLKTGVVFRLRSHQTESNDLILLYTLRFGVYYTFLRTRNRWHVLAKSF